MPRQETISTQLAKLHKASPAGFAIALHVKFTAPRYLFQSYSKEWLDTYSRLGLVLHDPVVHWGFSHTGAVRWSDLAAEDTAGVFIKAAEHGMKYGVIIAMVQGGSRTMAGFARNDREWTDVEITDLTADLERLHESTLTAEQLSPAVHETLKQMSIYLTHG